MFSYALHSYLDLRWKKWPSSFLNLCLQGSPERFSDYLVKYRNTICGRHPIAVLLNVSLNLLMLYKRVQSAHYWQCAFNLKRPYTMKRLWIKADWCRWTDGCRVFIADLPCMLTFRCPLAKLRITWVGRSSEIRYCILHFSSVFHHSLFHSPFSSNAFARGVCGWAGVKHWFWPNGRNDTSLKPS